ncbi:hypothetical protein [Coleofasciculus sp. H7-2]|uniref:hypothetical protein n=1 Tax=Coleofasciculus sp. H7-2 TaxID=3351545 RepID=UPI00366D11D8
MAGDSEALTCQFARPGSRPLSGTDAVFENCHSNHKRDSEALTCQFAQIHSHSIVHKNIKPQNILVNLETLDSQNR